MTKLSTLVLPCFAVFLLSAAPDPASLSVNVLEGNGAINNISRRTAYPPVVQVLDGAGRPVARATVTFTTPSSGPGATFIGGGTNLIVTTDEEGKASARGLTPNNMAGEFEIRVNANHEGQVARATVVQTNAAPLVARSRNGRTILIVGLIAGAAGGILAAAGGGGGGTSPSPPGGQQGSPPAANPGGVVTPGTPGFGPPQ